HEPLNALDGGLDGLDFYRRLTAEAPVWLRKGGTLILEIGYDQADGVCSLIDATEKFAPPVIIQDIAGNDRVVRASLKTRVGK
ncbi:MAG: hypothetical protein LBD12_05090, partial [Clostridiales Family XIII bacterium]|nr:hypothetical protein [Clostridiales Family XIII bacterium]